MFVRATYYREKKTVHYFDENGEETLYIGGSFAWRTNNPGNLAKPGKRIVSTYIGLAQRTSKKNSLFMIFPDRATGDAERIRLLKEVYGGSSIAAMMERYAPREENDTDAYIASVSTAAGVDKETRLDALTDDQFKKLAGAMAKKEGWIPGKIVPLGKPSTVELRDKLRQPLATQSVELKGARTPVTLKTDAGGALPTVYPKLFGDGLSLYLDQVGDKIGELVDAGKASAYTFIAPYFAMKSNTDVHETKDKTAPLVHIVKQGETLGTIAGKYGVSIDALAGANHIADRNRIFQRQHLRIPGKSAAGGQAPASTPAAKPAATPAAKPAARPSPTAAAAPVPAPRRAPAAAVQVDRQRTDKNHPITVLSSAVKEASGPAWCKRFMGNNTLSGLNADFRPKAASFIAALKAGGASVRISAVYRPIERSYLMYWAFMICRGTDPADVPSWPGVDIDWTHRGADGKPDAAKAKEAAEQMCKGYGIRPHAKSQKVGRPKRSRHNFGGALDMHLGGYVGKIFKDADGNDVTAKGFSSLVALGASYGVIYFPQENMHWSDTGH
ncbi:LysM peptidoglycan-binding domain-containing protein [Massilia forsythiae]|uniref:LysM peptidoglycan-binding domain-containing protein n=1 Tax=Massilia forsythiae TaxID=2728020 RepID=A0A7Z2W033_9BURK|nr:LysM peptidoglycan-binding domain-containing protein [Massilia forsythiae]QJE02032.1 LysM peptidoglycan-binding domain-containing protein [Massilia forsythiae]